MLKFKALLVIFTGYSWKWLFLTVMIVKWNVLHYRFSWSRKYVDLCGFFLQNCVSYNIWLYLYCSWRLSNPHLCLLTACWCVLGAAFSQAWSPVAPHPNCPARSDHSLTSQGQNWPSSCWDSKYHCRDGQDWLTWTFLRVWLYSSVNVACQWYCCWPRCTWRCIRTKSLSLKLVETCKERNLVRDLHVPSANLCSDCTSLVSLLKVFSSANYALKTMPYVKSDLAIDKTVD